MEGHQGPALADRARRPRRLRRRSRRPRPRGAVPAALRLRVDARSRATTRSRGKHPHYNMLDTLFVECVHGDLTIKVENNTETGQGIYAEPVDDANQSLDDARIFYATIGQAGRADPAQDPAVPRDWRGATSCSTRRSQRVIRADGIGQGCRVAARGPRRRVPGRLRARRRRAQDVRRRRDATTCSSASCASPNGEDVLYVYFRGSDGTYLLYAYNLIEKAIAAPIACNGYSLFADGRMVVMRATQPSRRASTRCRSGSTPFTSAEHRGERADRRQLPRQGRQRGPRARPVRRAVDRAARRRRRSRSARRSRTSSRSATRAIDAYYWLGHADAGDLKTAVGDVKRDREADPRRVREGRRARGRGEARARRGGGDGRRASCARRAARASTASSRSSTR